MKTAFKGIYWMVMMALSGVIAVKLTIPLLASWFGIQLTITGSSAVVGMYMYVLSSFIVSVGILVGLLVVGAILGFLGWCIYEWCTNKNQ